MTKNSCGDRQSTNEYMRNNVIWNNQEYLTDIKDVLTDVKNM